MGLYVVKRVLMAIPVMAIVAVIVFSLLYLVPGDAASIIAGNFASPEDVERIRLQMGLDQSFMVQFYQWVTGMAGGDFGKSIFYDMPVTTLMMQRLGPTLSLAFGTILVAVIIALPAGCISAVYSGRFVDRATMLCSVLGFSMPVFVVGYILIYLFSFKLQWFPIQGYVAVAEGFGLWLRSIALPCIALGLVFSALIARITRATVVEVLAQDFIRTAHAKGLSPVVIMIRHTLRNAAVPIVTVIGVSFVMLIGGVVITESVFNIPGLGRLVVDAITQRDFPIIRAMLLIFSGVYLLINLIIDIIYTLIDPRIQY